MRKKVLIVDDEDEVLEIFKKKLEKIDYEVLVANTGEKALKQAKGVDLDLVILDIMLPDIGGYEVCARLKSNQRSKKVPILILSGQFSPMNKDIAYRCGADSYVPKPCSSDMLIEEVLRLID